MRVLVVDHRDSFVWNVVQGLERAALELRIELQVDVARPAELREQALREEPPERIVLGPGPGGPDAASAALARALALDPPRGARVLGICLGHQIVARAHGARVVEAERPVHGHRATVEHDGRGCFAGLPPEPTVGRYHSLTVDPDSLPPNLEVSARTVDGVVMGLRHRRLPLESVQFHPDSVLSPDGPRLFSNLLRG
ncbi:MAG: aminodeoxychorismate/anthranilate synthase component II [Planctomycetota bacterium]